VTDDGVITSAWQAGQAVWPGIVIDRAQFAARVADLDGDAVARFAGDLYLAAACAAGAEGAIEAFERAILPAAVAGVRAIDGDPSFVEETVQRLREHLLVGDGARLAQYAARGTLQAWVGIAAARTALKAKRSQKRAREVGFDDDSWTGALAAISTNDPELELLKRQYAAAFGDALRDAARTLEPRLRSALRMSFVDALSIDEIGAIYSVHRATAARWIRSACDALFDATRTLLADRLQLTPSELDRMTAMVRSQIDVSLTQLLPSRL